MAVAEATLDEWREERAKAEEAESMAEVSAITDGTEQPFACPVTEKMAFDAIQLAGDWLN